MISVIDCDQVEEDVWEEPKVQADIMVAEFVHGKPYTCPALTPSKGKKMAKPKKEAYLFDISKTDQIFSYLIKDQQIKLLKSYKILLVDEIKGKKNYKQHHLWTHTINNCIIFRNAIQKTLKEGKLKQAKEEDITIDTNSFGLSINMVFVSITQKEQKERKVPRQEKKLKEKDETGPS